MQNGSDERVLQYKPTKFAAGTILPDAPIGQWEATVLRGKTKVSPTKNGDPMVTFQVRLDAAVDNEENESSQGTQLPLRVTFAGDKTSSLPAFAKRNTKLMLASLASQCNFDLDIIPEEVVTDDMANLPGEEVQAAIEAALAPFIEAVEGRQLDIWTTHRPDKRNPGQTQVDINLSKPGASYGAPSRPSDDDDDRDTAAGPGDKTAVETATNGHAKKGKKSRR